MEYFKFIFSAIIIDNFLDDNFKSDPSYQNFNNYELGELIGKGAYAQVR